MDTDRDMPNYGKEAMRSAVDGRDRNLSGSNAAKAIPYATFRHVEEQNEVLEQKLAAVGDKLVRLGLAVDDVLNTIGLPAYFDSPRPTTAAAEERACLPAFAQDTRITSLVIRAMKLGDRIDHIGEGIDGVGSQLDFIAKNLGN